MLCKTREMVSNGLGIFAIHNTDSMLQKMLLRIVHTLERWRIEIIIVGTRQPGKAVDVAAWGSQEGDDHGGVLGLEVREEVVGGPHLLESASARTTVDDEVDAILLHLLNLRIVSIGAKATDLARIAALVENGRNVLHPLDILGLGNDIIAVHENRSCCQGHAGQGQKRNDTLHPKRPSPKREKSINQSKENERLSFENILYDVIDIL